MPDYNARIELDSYDHDEAAVDVLMDLVAEHHGVVARAVHGGRVELILTVPADDLRQAVITALTLVLSTGHQVYALELLPTDEFHRRIDELAPTSRPDPAFAMSHQLAARRTRLSPASPARGAALAAATRTGSATSTCTPRWTSPASGQPARLTDPSGATPGTSSPSSAPATSPESSTP